MPQLLSRMCSAQDSRAAVRVPFTQIVPTVVKVVDTSNEGSSGAGWTIGVGGLVRRPGRSLDLLPMFKRSIPTCCQWACCCRSTTSATS